MVKRNIPADIRKYETKVVAGLTLRNLLCLIVGGGLAILVFFLMKDISIDVKGILAGAVAIPFILLGWIKPYGLPFEKFFKVYVLSVLLAPKNRVVKTDTETKIDSKEKKRRINYMKNWKNKKKDSNFDYVR